MTIEDLIFELNKWPTDTRIMIQGYEGGYEDINPTLMYEKKVVLNQNDSTYYGPHDSFYEEEEYLDGAEVVEVLVIGRASE